MVERSSFSEIRIIRLPITGSISEKTRYETGFPMDFADLLAKMPHRANAIIRKTNITAKTLLMSSSSYITYTNIYNYSPMITKILLQVGIMLKNGKKGKSGA